MKAASGSKGNLTVADLQAILDNASYPNEFITVFFSGFFEPLASANCLELIEVAHYHRYVRHVTMFSTGHELDEVKLGVLSQLPHFLLQLHLTPQIGLDRLHCILSYLPRSVCRAIGMEQAAFLRIKESCQSFPFAWFDNTPIISRAGNLTEVQEERIKTALVCEKTDLERRPVVLPDGTTVICSNDFGCEMKIGNLLLQKWDQLDFGRIIDGQQSPSSEQPCFRGCHHAVPSVKWL